MNPYVIPGLKEKTTYIEKVNNSKLVPSETMADLKDIYNTACVYFNIPQDTDLLSRKTEACKARHWTMFVAKCKGYSNSQIAAFFSKDPSTLQHVTFKIMNELQVYDQTREHFEYFINQCGLMAYYKNIARSNLKSFLKQYYRYFRRQIGLLSQSTSGNKSQKRDSRESMGKIVSQLQEKRKNLYQHIIDARELSKVDDAIETLRKFSQKRSTDHFIL